MTNTNNRCKYYIELDWLVLIMAGVLGLSSAFFAGAVGWHQTDVLTPLAIDLAKVLSLTSGGIFAWVTYAAFKRDNYNTNTKSE